jgi:hypothetical protein
MLFAPRLELYWNRAFSPKAKINKGCFKKGARISAYETTEQTLLISLHLDENQCHDGIKGRYAGF